MWKKWLWFVNRKILISLFFLILTGFLCIIKISIFFNYKLNFAQLSFVLKHAMIVAVGIVFMLMISNSKKENIYKIGVNIFIVMAILTLLSPLLAPKINSVRRWYRIFGFSLQPAEFMKTFFVFPLAKALQLDGFLAIGLMLFCVILCVLQPDLGMSFLIILVSFVMFWYHEKYIHYFYRVVGLCFGMMLLSSIFLARYALKRIWIFFGMERGFQITQAMLSFARSSFVGAGSHVFIPDSHCDFIFTEVCSNFGIIIGVFVLLQPLMIFINSTYSLDTLQEEQKYILIGLTSQLVIQSLFHILSNLALVPTKGVTLPFLSYGGSSIITHCISAGCILALTKKQICH